MAARDIQLVDSRYARIVTNPRAAASQSITTTYKPLSDGTTGTLESLRAMRQAVLNGLPPEYAGYQDNRNIQAAQSVGGQTSIGAQITNIYTFCRDSISYIDHPWNMQVVQDAIRTMQRGTGDCVSKSVLLSTLLASLGIKSRFVAQASTSEGFDHVYVEADVNGWLALDPTADGRDGRPSGEIGWTQRLQDGGFEMSFEIFDRGFL